MYPLWCRPGSSDASAFYQIFILRDYTWLDDVLDPGLVIDCGANVGY
jgi:FkbM family methyltransferase